ncbi:MAG: hypothetical protein KKF41_03515 [Actinobacteria bacterium]|nr:hypothetical protein [Actinomycetota bacterium]MBU1945030.1 hypothetical protein [Actinomycetota bacterium]MBU2686634.1 hypothetical protein [Actinomycetota bacterium]
MGQTSEARSMYDGAGGTAVGKSDQLNTVKRVFDVVNMWPKVNDPALEERVREFIMTAGPDEFLRMHRAAFDTVGPYLFEDDKIQSVIDDFEGRRIGFSIRKLYEATVTVEYLRFRVEPGIEPGVPVMWCASRQDYADAMLGGRDPFVMVLTRRIGATRMTTLLKWWLPHFDVLISEDVMDKYSSIQPDIDRAMKAHLAAMGY